tara:strand:+ start:860 stop:1153 length:294 start_codon:yes stop_codon:yes gene_type:complete
MTNFIIKEYNLVIKDTPKELNDIIDRNKLDSNKFSLIERPFLFIEGKEKYVITKMFSEDQQIIKWAEQYSKIWIYSVYPQPQKNGRVVTFIRSYCEE